MTDPNVILEAIENISNQIQNGLVLTLFAIAVVGLLLWAGEKK